jgi:hypothetical protein
MVRCCHPSVLASIAGCVGGGGMGDVLCDGAEEAEHREWRGEGRGGARGGRALPRMTHLVTLVLGPPCVRRNMRVKSKTKEETKEETKFPPVSATPSLATAHGAGALGLYRDGSSGDAGAAGGRWRPRGCWKNPQDFFFLANIESNRFFQNCKKSRKNRLDSMFARFCVAKKVFHDENIAGRQRGDLAWAHPYPDPSGSKCPPFPLVYPCTVSPTPWDLSSLRQCF